jgi:hypothetical protein
MRCVGDSSGGGGRGGDYAIAPGGKSATQRKEAATERSGQEHTARA